MESKLKTKYYHCFKCNNKITPNLSNTYNEESELICPLCGSDFIEETDDIVDVNNQEKDLYSSLKNDIKFDSNHKNPFKENKTLPNNSNNITNPIRNNEEFRNINMSIINIPNLNSSTHQVSIIRNININMNNSSNIQNIPFQILGNHRAIGDIIENINQILYSWNITGKTPASKEELDTLRNEEVDKYVVDNFKQDTCSICFDGFEEGNTISYLKCNHFFHNSCIKLWFEKSNNCPVCRAGLI